MGDAFASDHTLHAETPIGFDVVSTESILCSSTSAAEEVKSNIVAYIKAEGLPNNCRRMIAVSSLYTCYVVKKTLLRCIHNVSTLNLVIRGHTSPVLDIKFSPAASDILCSIDNATSEGGHVFVFQLMAQEDSLISKTLCEMKLKAQMVHPHPHLPQVWAIANGDKVGIISYSMSGVDSFTEYEELSLFVRIANFVTGNDRTRHHHLEPFLLSFSLSLSHTTHTHYIYFNSLTFSVLSFPFFSNTHSNAYCILFINVQMSRFLPMHRALLCAQMTGLKRGHYLPQIY